MVNNLISLLMGKLRSLVGRYVVSRKAHDALALERNALQIERDALKAECDRLYYVELLPHRVRAERIAKVHEVALKELYSGLKTCLDCMKVHQKTLEDYEKFSRETEEAREAQVKVRMENLTHREQKLMRYGVYPEWLEERSSRRGQVTPVGRLTFNEYRRVNGIKYGKDSSCQLCKDLNEPYASGQKMIPESWDDTRHYCPCGVVGCSTLTEDCPNL